MSLLAAWQWQALRDVTQSPLSGAESACVFDVNNAV